MANKIAIVRLQLKEPIRLVAGPGPGVSDFELSDPAVARIEAEFIPDEPTIITRLFLTNGDLMYIPEHNVLAITLDII